MEPILIPFWRYAAWSMFMFIAGLIGGWHLHKIRTLRPEEGED